MHHAAPGHDSNACSCRSASDDGLTVIASLLGDSAVLTAPTRAAAEPSLGERAVQPARSRPLDLFLVPDAPPPRA